MQRREIGLRAVTCLERRPGRNKQVDGWHVAMTGCVVQRRCCSEQAAVALIRIRTRFERLRQIAPFLLLGGTYGCPVLSTDLVLTLSRCLLCTTRAIVIVGSIHSLRATHGAAV